MALRRTRPRFAPAVLLALFLGMFAPDRGEERPVPPRCPGRCGCRAAWCSRCARSGPTATGSSRCPTDARTAGWWRGGARLGDAFGSTLLAAHVDSRQRGLGPYAELYATRPGARVVLRSDDLRQVFRIRSVRLVPRGSVASRPGLYSPAGERRLVLVTCAPPYDERLGYLNLVVVTAAPTGPARAAR